MRKTDVVIIGAGPYGLSAAAHLNAVRGLDVVVFGQPMSFWQCHMPEGMILRSPREASNFADPDGRLTLDAFERARGRPLSPPSLTKVDDEYIVKNYSQQVPLQDFIQYGHWFQKKSGLDVDRRKVLNVEPGPEGYQLSLEDGEILHARRVVVAAGIQPFAHRPEPFNHLPASLLSHTSEHRDLKGFRGKEVLVIGGGQSALETAALLYEAGAQVEVLVREGVVHWLRMKRRWMHKKAVSWMFYGRGDVGPAFVSLFVQRPSLFQHLPRTLFDRWAKRAIRPAAACWVKARTAEVVIQTARFVSQAVEEGGRVRVRLNDGTERVADHILLGTGYRINIELYSFLSTRLLERIDCANGYPKLNHWFETSSPNLHFMGATAAWSFGPLMRFVVGAEFAANALKQRLSNGFAR